MNFFSRIKRKIDYRLAIRNSSSYISFLRKKGIKIGQDCYFQSPKATTIDITRPALVDIGNNCRFLTNFLLLTHDSVTKVFGPLYHDFIPSSGKVIVGNNVYFARNCTVLKGVSIGDNCIIGFGSTVMHDIPANSVAVGTPAIVVSTIEEYYEKRKKKSILEAFELAQIIYKKTGKRPTEKQMWEEFPFWMDGDETNNQLRFSVAYQTRGFYDIYKKEHKALYKSFDEFIDAALTYCEEKSVISE